MTVEEQVFRFEITVDDVARMQIVKGLDDARRVEASGRVVKVTAITQDRPQFAAKAGLHQHVDVLVIPVRIIQSVILNINIL